MAHGKGKGSGMLRKTSAPCLIFLPISVSVRSRIASRYIFDAFAESYYCFHIVILAFIVLIIGFVLLLDVWSINVKISVSVNILGPPERQFARWMLIFASPYTHTVGVSGSLPENLICAVAGTALLIVSSSGQPSPLSPSMSQ